MVTRRSSSARGVRCREQPVIGANHGGSNRGSNTALRARCAGGRVNQTPRYRARHGDQVRVGDRVAQRSGPGVAAGADGARTIADLSQSGAILRSRVASAGVRPAGGNRKRELLTDFHQEPDMGIDARGAAASSRLHEGH
jgi:hypothetical protein